MALAASPAFLQLSHHGRTGDILRRAHAAGGFLLWRGKLFHARVGFVAPDAEFPLPYIANTAGWMTAEIGRQPWLVYGLIRTSDGYSKNVSAGNTLFTLLGFMGMYTVLSILFIVLVYRIVSEGPSAAARRERQL